MDVSIRICISVYYTSIRNTYFLIWINEKTIIPYVSSVIQWKSLHYYYCQRVDFPKAPFLDRTNSWEEWNPYVFLFFPSGKMKSFKSFSIKNELHTRRPWPIRIAMVTRNLLNRDLFLPAVFHYEKRQTILKK